MSQDHTLMGSRYELKYLITEELALKIRSFVQQYLEVDEYGAGQPNLSYPIHSLYLDSDDWKIYWRTVNGDKNRYKLRLRYYTESRKVPVFFEIKRRMKDVILKQRAGIWADGVNEILAGHIPGREHFAHPTAEEYRSIQNFLELMLDVNARPKMQVSYDREAYVNSTNNEVRITLDRHVRCVRRDEWVHSVQTPNPFICSDRIVILELKFTNRFPYWYRDLVQAFDCFQCGAAKYVEGTTLYAGRHLPAQDVIRNMVL